MGKEETRDLMDFLTSWVPGRNHGNDLPAAHNPMRRRNPGRDPDMPFDAHLVVVAGAFAYGLEAMRILSESSPKVHALLDTLAQKLNERFLAGLAEADTLGFIGHAGGA